MRPELAAPLLALLAGAMGCSRGTEGAVAGDGASTIEASASASREVDEAVEQPLAPRDDTAELALLSGLTETLSARDVDGLKRWLSPELAAELRRQHDADPADFWARGAVWTELAATGLTLATRQSSDGFDRWRGLVRFGSGAEESVTFGRFDGRVLLADL
jgi:hypothetical protein